MTGEAVNGRNGHEARAGARTLNLLASPLNCAILRALHDGRMQQVELRREAGHPAQTTLRTQLKRLYEAGTIEKCRRNRFPSVLEYRLSEAGNDLLPVATALQRWLARSPGGALDLGGDPAKATVKALAEAWSATMLHALAARPLTLTELDGAIASLNYPSLERRLSAMRLTGLAEAHEGDGRGNPYGVTEWTRRGIAPIMAASRWERRHAPVETAPIATDDVESAFLLAADLLSPPADAAGSCRLAVEMRTEPGVTLAGLLVVVRDGRLVSRSTRLDGCPDAWVSGSLAAWFAAMIELDHTALELGGNCSLAHSLLGSLHNALLCSKHTGPGQRLFAH